MKNKPKIILVKIWYYLRVKLICKIMVSNLCNYIMTGFTTDMEFIEKFQARRVKIKKLLSKNEK